MRQAWPNQTHGSNYTFCNGLGAEAVAERLEGLAVPSARQSGGTNVPVFAKRALSNPRAHSFVEVKCNASNATRRTLRVKSRRQSALGQISRSIELMLAHLLAWACLAEAGRRVPTRARSQSPRSPFREVEHVRFRWPYCRQRPLRRRTCGGWRSGPGTRPEGLARRNRSISPRIPLAGRKSSIGCNLETGAPPRIAISAFAPSLLSPNMD